MNISNILENNLINCAGLSMFINYCKKINFFKLIDTRLHSPAKSDGFLPSDFLKVFIALVDGVCVIAELEPGNHSPSDNVFERTKSCVELAAAGNIKIGKIREDAAGYVGDIINYCNKKEIKFYIRAAKDPGVKASVKTIRTREEGEACGYKGKFLKSCWKDTEIKVAGQLRQMILKIHRRV